MKKIASRFVALLLSFTLVLETGLAQAIGPIAGLAGQLDDRSTVFTSQALSPTEGAARFIPGKLNQPSYQRVFNASASLRGPRLILGFPRRYRKQTARGSSDRRRKGAHYHEFIDLKRHSDPIWENKVLNYLRRYSYNAYSSEVLAELFYLAGEDVERSTIVLALQSLEKVGEIKKIHTGSGKRGAWYSVDASPINKKGAYGPWNPESPTKEAVFNALQKLSRRYNKPVSLTLIRFELNDQSSVFEEIRQHLTLLVKEGVVVMTPGNPKKYYAPKASISGHESAGTEIQSGHAESDSDRSYINNSPGKKQLPDLADLQAVPHPLPPQGLPAPLNAQELLDEALQKAPAYHESDSYQNFMAIGRALEKGHFYQAAIEVYGRAALKAAGASGGMDQSIQALMDQLLHAGLDPALEFGVRAILEYSEFRGIPWQLAIEDRRTLRMRAVPPGSATPRDGYRDIVLYRMEKGIEIFTSRPDSIGWPHQQVVHSDPEVKAWLDQLKEAAKPGSHHRGFFTSVLEYGQRWRLRKDSFVSNERVSVLFRLTPTAGVQRLMGSRQRICWLAVQSPVSIHSIRQAFNRQFPEIASQVRLSDSETLPDLFIDDWVFFVDKKWPDSEPEASIPVRISIGVQRDLLNREDANRSAEEPVIVRERTYGAVLRALGLEEAWKQKRISIGYQHLITDLEETIPDGASLFILHVQGGSIGEPSEAGGSGADGSDKNESVPPEKPFFILEGLSSVRSTPGQNIRVIAERFLRFLNLIFEGLLYRETITEKTLKIIVAPIGHALYFRPIFLIAPLIVMHVGWRLDTLFWGLPIVAIVLVGLEYMFIQLYGSAVIHPAVYEGTEKLPRVATEVDWQHLRDREVSEGVLVLIPAFVFTLLPMLGMFYFGNGHWEVPPLWFLYGGIAFGIVMGAIYHGFRNAWARENHGISGTPAKRPPDRGRIDPEYLSHPENWSPEFYAEAVFRLWTALLNSLYDTNPPDPPRLILDELAQIICGAPGIDPLVVQEIQSIQEEFGIPGKKELIIERTKKLRNPLNRQLWLPYWKRWVHFERVDGGSIMNVIKPGFWKSISAGGKSILLVVHDESSLKYKGGEIAFDDMSYDPAEQTIIVPWTALLEIAGHFYLVWRDLLILDEEHLLDAARMIRDDLRGVSQLEIPSASEFIQGMIRQQLYGTLAYAVFDINSAGKHPFQMAKPNSLLSQYIFETSRAQADPYRLMSFISEYLQNIISALSLSQLMEFVFELRLLMDNPKNWEHYHAGVFIERELMKVLGITDRRQMFRAIDALGLAKMRLLGLQIWNDNLHDHPDTKVLPVPNSDGGMIIENPAIAAILDEVSKLFVVDGPEDNIRLDPRPSRAA